MNETEHLLTCLAEECAEVTQRVTKALRFGLSEIQDMQQLDNAERLNQEFSDLIGVFMMLQEKGVMEIDWHQVHAKKARVHHYMQKSIKTGALQP